MSQTINGEKRYVARKIIPLTIVSDNKDEEDESLSAILSYGQQTGGITFTDAEMTITILDDDVTPTLAIDNQTIYSDKRFSYTIQSSNISHIEDGESYTVALTDNGGSGVSYNGNSGTFTGNNISSGTYTLQGTISDNNTPANSSNWAFNLNVIDPPGLNINNQIVEIGGTFSYEIQSDDLVGIGSGETATITISSDGGSGITFSNNTFSRSTVFTEIATYTIEGTISNGKVTRNWNFDVETRYANSVSMVARFAQTTLNISESVGTTNLEVIVTTQTDRIPNSFDVSVSTRPSTAQSPDDYTSINEQLIISPEDFVSQTINGEKRYVARKIIPLIIVSDNKDEEDESLSAILSYGQQTGGITFTDAEMTITILDDDVTPTLAIDNQTIYSDKGFSYTIQSSDLSHIEDGESYTVMLTDNGGSGVSYNGNSGTFTGNNISSGTYTLQGTISDNNTPANSSNWAFNLNVIDYQLRFLFAKNPKVMGEVLTVVNRAISTYLIKKAGLTKKSGAKTGSVTFIQRFGGSLNLNIHFHMMILDGVYTFNEGQSKFHFITPPSLSEMEGLLTTIAQRVVKLLEKRELIIKDDTQGFMNIDSHGVMDQIHGSSISYRIAFGKYKGRKALTLQTVSSTNPQTQFLAKHSGFNLHAGVSCGTNDRKKENAFVGISPGPA